MRAKTLARQIRSRLVASHIPQASFEAELLVRTAGSFTRSQFFLDPKIHGDVKVRALALTERRLRREPFAYLSGEREFFGLTFQVAPGVLVPRPETEGLVELALAESGAFDRPLIVDVGTGCGAVAISIAMNLSGESEPIVIASDLSDEALTIAAQNRLRHRAQVALLRSDLLATVSRADIVVTNPPYIPTREIRSLAPEIEAWEPRLALDGGPDGMDVIRRILADCGSRLQPKMLAIEVGSGMAPRVIALAQAAGASARAIADLSGIARFVVARWG